MIYASSFSRKLTRLVIFMVLMFASIKSPVALAADPQLQWAMNYGGKAEDSAAFVKQTKDGGYIMAGATASWGYGQTDAYLLKIDAEGKLIWEKTFGTGGEEGIKCVAETSDGGYILAGYTKPSGYGQRDIYLIKTDGAGNKIWEKQLGGSENDEALNIKANKDGTYVLAGVSQENGHTSKAYWARLDSRGGIIWEQTYGHTGLNGANWIECLADNTCLITGYSGLSSQGDTGVLLIKTDQNGKPLWQQSYGEKAGMNGGNCVRTASDGTIIVVGYKYIQSSGGTNVYLLKTDASGVLIWERDYKASYKNTGNMVETTADGGYVILGNTFSYGTAAYGAYLIKTDAAGTKITDKVWGRTGPDVATCGQQTSDGFYVIAGTKNIADAGGNNAFLMKGLVSQDESQINSAAVTSPEAASAADGQNAGSGSITWPDMSVYKGYIVSGKANGWGRITFPDGSSYEGNWQNNLFNGQGTLVTAEGCKYTGGFRDNMFYGQGVYTWPGGEKYDGSFRYNKRNGEGTFYWANGVKYSGEWLDDKAHGYGTITWPGKESYTGQMTDGQVTGLGTYCFANGEKYVGQLKNMVFSGLGTYYWPSGAQYTGEFKDDRMNGQGTYTWPNGIQQWGYWQDDRYIGLYPEGFGASNESR